MNPEQYLPRIMRPGELERLNQFVMDALGTPIFFLSPPPAHPAAEGPRGRLYQVVTGLYVIYKDYGMQLFRTYLDFCRRQFPQEGGFVFPHYHSVSKLRGGLCHGCVPDGRYVRNLLRTLGFYVDSAGEGPWPEVLSGITEAQCGQVLRRLSQSSDRLVDYVERCAQRIAGDGQLLRQWREELLRSALNGEQPQYSQNKSYFDPRIIQDILGGIPNASSSLPHQTAVQAWLRELRPRVEAGEIVRSDTLYETLWDALNRLYNPTPLASSRSSAELLLGGLGLWPPSSPGAGV